MRQLCYFYARIGACTYLLQYLSFSGLTALARTQTQCKLVVFVKHLQAHQLFDCAIMLNFRIILFHSLMHTILIVYKLLIIIRNVAKLAHTLSG